MNRYENITENKGKKKTNRVFGFNFDFEVGTFESLHENLHFFYLLKFLFIFSGVQNWIGERELNEEERYRKPRKIN